MSRCPISLQSGVTSVFVACLLLVGCRGGLSNSDLEGEGGNAGGGDGGGGGVVVDVNNDTKVDPPVTCTQVMAGAPLRRLNTTELEYAVVDVYGGEPPEQMDLVAMAPTGDECDTTSECKGIWGPESNDCRDSRSATSICMCGNVPCYEFVNQQNPPSNPQAIAPNFVDALPQEGVLGGFSTVGSALDSGVLFGERYLQEIESLAEPIVATLEKTCQPQAGRQGECGMEILGGRVKRLWRRDLTAQERAGLADLITQVSQELDFERGLQAGVMASLTSKNFLFVEPEVVEPGARALTGREMATKLALSLWLSVPDEALLDAAAAGELATPEGVAAQVDRMMQHERFARFTKHLVDRWLGLDQLNQADVDLEAYGLSEGEWLALRADLREEAQRLVEHIIKEDRPIVELFQADYSFLSPRLVEHYGLAANVPDGEFARVPLPAGSGRAGVLTQGGFLATLGSGAKISVIHRGASVLGGYLCETFPDPPDAILEEIEAQEEAVDLTERQKLEARAMNPTCLGCHHAIDPVGWSFAQFDNLGSPRTTDSAGAAIDTQGAYRQQDFVGADGFVSLINMSEGRRFESCMTSRLLTYAGSRVFNVNARKEDACLVDGILDNAQTAGQQAGLRTVIRGLFLSPAFRQQGPEIIEGAVK